MKQLRKSNNVTSLIHCLRQDLHKNMGGIANPVLYEECMQGTKHLIEKYHNEVIKCVRYIFYYKGKQVTLP